jgi:uncharacterized protein
MTSFGLEQHILDKIIAVLAAHPQVERAVIYGSRATGNFKPHSDIDLAVYSSRISGDEFGRLRFEIQELPMVFKLDVVFFEELGNAELKNKITQEGKTIYQRPAEGANNRG